jgi:hypothetical protein
VGKLSHFLATSDHEVRASRLGLGIAQRTDSRGISVDDEVLIGLDVEEGDHGLTRQRLVNPAVAGPSTARAIPFRSKPHASQRDAPQHAENIWHPPAYAAINELHRGEAS